MEIEEAMGVKEVQDKIVRIQFVTRRVFPFHYFLHFLSILNFLPVETETDDY